MLDTSRVNSGTVRHLQEMKQGVANLTSQVWKLLFFILSVNLLLQRSFWDPTKKPEFMLVHTLLQ